MKMGTYSTILDMGVAGEQAVTVYFQTTKERQATSIEPAEPAAILLDSVSWDGLNILIHLSDATIDEIKEEINGADFDSEYAACAADARGDQMREQLIFKDAA